MWARSCELADCSRNAFGLKTLCAQHYLTSNTRMRAQDGRVHHDNLDLSRQRLRDATIKDVVFDGETYFYSCEFAGEVRFENCTFAGYVSFTESTAERLAFRDCRFMNIVNLTDTTFADLSIRRSEFEAPVELELGGSVEIHLTTFSGRARLIGDPHLLELKRVALRGGAECRLADTKVILRDVEFGASSALGPNDPVPGGLVSLYSPFGGFIDSSGGVWGSHPPRLLGVADTDMSRLSVFQVDLSRCTFTGAHNLDGFNMDSLVAFSWTPRGRFTRRRVLWDEARLRSRHGRSRHRWQAIAGPDGEQAPLQPAQVASDYRALRKAREDAKDEPGAADLYYGEMEMRRLARYEDARIAWRRVRGRLILHLPDVRQDAASWTEWVAATTEHTLLWLYWAVSGYGLRAWRALTALVVVLLGASVILRFTGFPGDTHTYAASLRFSVQSAMSLLRGTDERLTPTGEWVAMVLRLLGPLLFGLALLALRGRVRR